MNANIVKASVNGKVIPASLTNTNGYTEVSLNGLQICANDKLQIDFLNKKNGMRSQNNILVKMLF